MIKMKRIILLLSLAWLSGGIILSGLWMNDEVLSEALFCRFCVYPIPLVGNVTEYQGESIAWGLVFIGIVLIFTIFRLVRSELVGSDLQKMRD